MSGNKKKLCPAKCDARRRREACVNVWHSLDKGDHCEIVCATECSRLSPLCKHGLVIRILFMLRGM